MFLNSCVAEQVSNGLAPEVVDLNAKDVSYALEHKLPYLEEPYISTSPKNMKDGITVGKLGVDGGNKDKILAFADFIAQPAKDPKSLNTDSLLISYKRKLIFESYYRRGRANYPHYQMSIAKAYTAMAIGRAIQLGHMSNEDLNKPILHFLKDIDASKIASGAENITLEQAMCMGSGLRLDDAKVRAFRQKRNALKGQGQIQAYLESSASVPPAPREFKYQPSDPSIAMQVLETCVPGGAREFIENQFWGKMGITNYHWQDDVSGFPKAAAGCSVRSRDMLKMGLLVLDKGKWQGEQLLPEDFCERATNPVKVTSTGPQYGYYWWVENVKVGNKTYLCKQGRGAGGQFIFIYPELELIIVMTAHNKGMGKMLYLANKKVLPAFLK
ncbi:MAG: serine hydrolase [Planctomycetes bacterium]|nr:serine hydrolase [Planctomycetota bacterium]